MANQFENAGLSLDSDFLYDIRIDTGKNNRIIHPCRSKEGLFSVSLTSKSNDYQPFSLDQLIDAFARGAFDTRGTIRMKAKGEAGNGNGRSPVRPQSPARAEISDQFLRVVKGADRAKLATDSDPGSLGGARTSRDKQVASFLEGGAFLSEDDLLNILNRQRENGAAGELIAMNWEIKRLKGCGCSAPVDFVDHTSKKNVAAGFDIYSNWNADQERFIEVKTTASGAKYFFMSENEKRVLTDKAGKSYIYIVDLDSSGKNTGTVRTPIKFDEAAFEFEPVAYRVRLKR